MVEEVSSREVYERLDELQVIDIRDQIRFQQGHVPGAENLPMRELTQRLDEKEWKDEIVVVCPIGQSSIQAARLIESYEGVDEDARVASLEGGYDGWTYELESGFGEGESGEDASV
ncbi:MAG: rhodanese-like domain-containing protein [Halobacteria archaeon]